MQKSKLYLISWFLFILSFSGYCQASQVQFSRRKRKDFDFKNPFNGLGKSTKGVTQFSKTNVNAYMANPNEKSMMGKGEENLRRRKLNSKTSFQKSKEIENAHTLGYPDRMEAHFSSYDHSQESENDPSYFTSENEPLQLSSYNIQSRDQAKFNRHEEEKEIIDNSNKHIPFTDSIHNQAKVINEGIPIHSGYTTYNHFDSSDEQQPFNNFDLKNNRNYNREYDNYFGNDWDEGYTELLSSKKMKKRNKKSNSKEKSL